MMEPATIIGAVVGSFANKMLPSLVISVLLVIVLSLMAHRTLSRGLKSFRKEAVKKAIHDGGVADMTSLLSEEDRVQAMKPHLEPHDSAMTTAATDSDSEEESQHNNEGPSTSFSLLATIKRLPSSLGLNTSVASSSSSSSSSSSHISLVPQTTPAAMVIAEEERFTPVWKPLALVMCFLGVVAIDILKGGDGKSVLGFSCGSPLYWLITLAAIPWVGLFFFFFRHQLLSNYQRKIDASYRWALHLGCASL